MRYFLDNQDDVWAIDEEGREFLVTKKGLIPTESGSIDPMWGGVDESEIALYIR